MIGKVRELELFFLNGFPEIHVCMVQPPPPPPPKVEIGLSYRFFYREQTQEIRETEDIGKSASLGTDTVVYRFKMFVWYAC